MPCNTLVLTKGQVITKYYRWMNKNGGWVWMQTKASLIPHPDNPEIKQMLCLNYIVRYLECFYLVLSQMGNHNLKIKEEFGRLCVGFWRRKEYKVFTLLGKPGKSWKNKN